MNYIKLIEPGHIYVNLITGENYESMSNVVGHFSHKFNVDYHSKRMAYQDLVPGYPSIIKKYKEDDYAAFEELDQFIVDRNLFNIYVNNYQKKWAKKGDKSRDDGTVFHKQMEEEDIKRGYCINPINNKPYKVYTSDQFDPNNIKPGCYLETALHDPDSMVAGTPDKFFLCFEFDELLIDLLDYKTNEDLFTGAYKNRKFKKPLSHLAETKINKYALAMSGYLYFLLLLGAKPRSSTIIYSADKINMGIYRMPIIIEDSKKMLKAFKESNSQVV